MTNFERIAAGRIREAMELAGFENLPGSGNLQDRYGEPNNANILPFSCQIAHHLNVVGPNHFYTILFIMFILSKLYVIIFMKIEYLEFSVTIGCNSIMRQADGTHTSTSVAYLDLVTAT